MNWKKILLFALPGLILGIGGAIFAVYVVTNPKIFMEWAQDGTLTNMSFILPAVIGGIVIITMIAAFFPILKGLSGDSKQAEQLRQNGVKTMAKILKVEDTGITLNRINFYVNITVETTKGSQATFRHFVSRVNIPRPGDMIEIVYDPSDPTKAAASVET